MAVEDASNRARVVIVDDNLELAENIAEILGLEGHPTEVFESAEEALPNALSEDVAIIVTDYRLPGMTGAEFLKLIRQVRRQLHAVVISAYTDDETMKAAREADARFLPKPVDFAWLRTFVREFGQRSE
jgi:DNA-binding NtrC family response regulator